MNNMGIEAFADAVRDRMKQKHKATDAFLDEFLAKPDVQDAINHAHMRGRQATAVADALVKANLGTTRSPIWQIEFIGNGDAIVRRADRSEMILSPQGIVALLHDELHRLRREQEE